MRPFPWSATAGAEVEIEGYVTAAGGRSLILAAEPPCCPGCPPDPARVVEVLAEAPIAVGTGAVRLAGRWQPLAPGDAAGWRWQLRGARLLGRVGMPGPWMRRRAVLAGLPLACVAASTGCAVTPQPERAAAARALVAGGTPADLHSHAGRVILGRPRPTEPLAAPLREGGMRLVALAMVADSPVVRVTPDNRLAAWREPAPGELARHSEAAFARLQGLLRDQGLAAVTDRGSLAAAMAPGGAPAVVVAAEGADFLEGRIEALEAAFTAQRLRHLQLVHYRVNALGDIQTEPPVHGGLTGFGAEVVRACNRLGIVVDVAHATFAMVEQVAAVAVRPLVLSHTSLTQRPGPRSRQVTREHARLVAGTGGVVGIWPPVTVFPTLAAYTEGLARSADAIGVEHVGVGSDMLGLLSGAAFGDYRQTPALAEAMLAAGFAPAEAAKVLGGNYARVLAACLPG
jgi:membrane dipeptidase